MAGPNELINSTTGVLNFIGPVAGMFVVARMILSFQRMVVDGAVNRASILESRLTEVEEQVELLKDEVNMCEERNSKLVRAIHQAGINLPDI
jgi:hypothetical protein